jgi:hypothetical protein
MNSLDTSAWRDDELPSVLLIRDRNETIKWSYVQHKLNPSTKEQVRTLRKKVTRFNAEYPQNRDITYLSRPLLDATGQHALIFMDNGHGGLGGGGAIWYLDRKEGH